MNALIAINARKIIQVHSMRKDSEIKGEKIIQEKKSREAKKKNQPKKSIIIFDPPSLELPCESLPSVHPCVHSWANVFVALEGGDFLGHLNGSSCHGRDRNLMRPRPGT